jgi:hypothetical protein
MLIANGRFALGNTFSCDDLALAMIAVVLVVLIIRVLDG